MMFGADKDVAVTPVVQNAQYVSGNAIGALSTVSVARGEADLSGILNNFWIASQSGQTPVVTVYIFSAKPTASTVTDKSAFSLAAADLSKLVVAPFALTLAVPTGTSASFAQASNIGAEWVNQDATQTPNLYVALVSGSTFTPGSVTDIVFKLSVTQD